MMGENVPDLSMFSSIPKENGPTKGSVWHSYLNYLFGFPRVLRLASIAFLTLLRTVIAALSFLLAVSLAHPMRAVARHRAFLLTWGIEDLRGSKAYLFFAVNTFRLHASFASSIVCIEEPVSVQYTRILC